MDNSLSREEYIQKNLEKYGWTSWHPEFPEVYTFATTEINSELHIGNQSVLILCSKHYVNSPSFYRFIKIGKYDDKGVFWIDPQKTIFEKINIFIDEVEKERRTLLYRFSTLLYECFRVCPIYTWNGWKVKNNSYYEYKTYKR